MTRRRRLGPALLPLLLVTAPAAAQDGDRPASHVRIDPAPGTDLAQLFNERIKQSKLRTGLADILQQLRSGGNPQDLQTRLNALLAANPDLQDMVRGFNDPEGRERLQGLIGGELQNQPEWMKRVITPELVEQQLRNLSAGSQPGLAQPRPRESSRPGTRPRSDAPAPRGERSGAERPASTPQEQESRRALARNIAEWAGRFPQDRLPGPLRNSPAVRGVLDDLTRALHRGGSGEGLDAELARWEGRLNALRDWLPSELPERLADHLPDLSGLPRPNVRLPAVDWSPPAAPSGPRLGAPAVDPAGLGQVVLVAAALALAAGVLWRLRAVRAAPAAGRRRGLGPWPLDPAAVATRADLIRAFEYLSLARCGEAARSWHHRAIAERLGGGAAERRAAAERLAALYEQARYAPAHQPEPDWTDARRPLTFLAGMGS